MKKLQPDMIVKYRSSGIFLGIIYKYCIKRTRTEFLKILRIKGRSTQSYLNGKGVTRRTYLSKHKQLCCTVRLKDYHFCCNTKSF